MRFKDMEIKIKKKRFWEILKEYYGAILQVVKENPALLKAVMKILPDFKTRNKEKEGGGR